MPQLSIAYLNDFVAHRKGACLSKEYIDTETTYKWRCKKGHTWDMQYRTIRAGSWCPMCTRERDMNEFVEICKAYAKERNGVFLTTSLEKKKDRSLWQCEKGHKWSACTATVINRSSWCFVCSRRQRIQDINIAREYAKSRGGKCLSESVNGVWTVLKLECAEGHQWESKFANFKYGHWCKICSNKISGLKRRISYAEIVRICNKNKVQILTPEKKYTTQQQKLNMICNNGHKWEDNAQNIVYSKRGCPICTSRRAMKHHSLEEMKAIAEKHGGYCLSKEYVPVIMLEWKCRNNHVFKMTSTSVLKGSWCRQCD